MPVAPIPTAAVVRMKARRESPPGIVELVVDIVSSPFLMG